MPQCQGIKRDGGRCIVIVAPGVTHCYHHASERAEQRRRNASIAVCSDIEPPVRAHFDAAASDARIAAVYCSRLAIGMWVNYCAYHSKGGKSKGNSEISDLKKQLKDLAKGVLDGEVERGTAAVVNQILNTRARLIEIERKIREQEELEERLEALEGVLKMRKAAR